MKKIISLFLVLFFNITYSQVIVCHGTTKAYSVDTADGANGTPGSNYFWQVKNADGIVNSTPIITSTTASGNSISINWSATTEGTYTIEVVETNVSCTAPASILAATIKSNPTVTVNNTEVCLGSNTTMQATSSPSNPTDTFSWTTPLSYTGTVNTNTITITSATVSVAGNYAVTVTDTDGCVSDTVAVVLVVNPLPDASIVSATTTEFCDGGSVVLTAPIGLSYVWNKVAIAISPSATGGSYSASQSGNYTVTTTDSKGCSNTTNLATTVTINPNPIVSVSTSVNQFCDGSSAVLTASSTSGTAPFTYQWRNNSGDITVNVTNASYIATTTSDYKVKVTDSKGCSVLSGVHSIFNRPNPDANINALSATTFCAGESVVLQRGALALPGLTYQWLKGARDILSSTNFNYTATESGSYKVRVVDTNFSTNCITISASPIVVVKTDLPITSAINVH